MAAALVLASIATGIATAIATATPRASPAATATVVTVGGPATSSAIPPGFLGLSIEYFAIPAYAGTDPNAIDPVFVQLLRNLAGASPPELRIGGDTTDWTWWPVSDTPTPAGVNEALTPAWTAIANALATETGARITLGINLEADSSTVAGTEASELVDGIGAGSIQALELGNEPELYGTFTWGHSHKPGRPHGYGFAAFNRDFGRISQALPDLPLAGPTSGAAGWFKDVARFLADNRRVALTTLHRYPLQLCYRLKSQPDYPTIPHLLASRSSQGLANSVAAAVRASHARHIPVRIDELNTIGCGINRTVGESFASALWAVDTLFNMARVGVDGVNFSTFPGATDQLFTFSQADGGWQAFVEPEYYGLEMFEQAAPAGSRLLKVSTTNAPHLEVYATRASDNTLRVVAINEGPTARTVRVKAPGTATGTGSLELLTAPSLRARTGVTLGGQSFGAATTTGLLAGTQKTSAITQSNHEYTLRVPPGSAALLTLPG